MQHDWQQLTFARICLGSHERRLPDPQFRALKSVLKSIHVPWFPAPQVRYNAVPGSAPTVTLRWVLVADRRKLSLTVDEHGTCRSKRTAWDGDARVRAHGLYTPPAFGQVLDDARWLLMGEGLPSRPEGGGGLVYRIFTDGRRYEVWAKGCGSMARLVIARDECAARAWLLHFLGHEAPLVVLDPDEEGLIRPLPEDFA